jgi:1,2-diacylglycerol 3-beta-galactosyltransferase
MPDKKRFLILTADAGFGHRSAAKAVAEALRIRRGGEVEVEVVNPLDHPKAPAWLRKTQSDYDRMAREAADLYKLGYDLSDTSLATRIVDSAVRVLLFRAMRDIVKEARPDAIVSTYPLYQAPLEALYALTRCSVPTVSVVTDLATVHQVWFAGSPDLFVVPTDIVRSIAISAGAPAERVEVIGIPVSPAIAGKGRSKAEERAALGWERDSTCVLAIGSKRVARLGAVVNVLNHSGLPLSLAIVAGGDERRLEELRATEWHRPARVYGYVEDLPSMMRAADLVISKAGGLVVTESLAAGLPLALIDVLPGQEVGNAEYVASGGAGEVAKDPVAALEILCHWLEDGGKLLAERAARARELGRPNAAFDVAERAWELAQPREACREPPTNAALARLSELFKRFGERSDE